MGFFSYLAYKTISPMKTSRSIYYLLGFISFSLFITACNPDEPEPQDLPEYAISVDLSHSYSGEELLLNGPYYLTENGDSFQLTKLIYHINNFQFFDASGNLLKESDEYFMVDLESNASPSFDFGVFDGEVDSICFTVGVADSAVSANGDLNNLFTDPMYWGMVNGYINFKLEGLSPSVSNEAVVLHVGGYVDPFNTSRKIGLSLRSNPASSQLGNNVISFELDLSKYFHSPNTIDLATTNLLHAPNDQAMKIADNWLDMFEVK